MRHKPKTPVWKLVRAERSQRKVAEALNRGASRQWMARNNRKISRIAARN